MTQLNSGWVLPTSTLPEINKADSRALAFKKEKFRGIHKVTEKAFLVIINDNWGRWIPKSVVMDIYTYPDHSVEMTMFEFAHSNDVKIDPL